MKRYLTTLAVGLTILGCAPKQEKSDSPVNPQEYTTSNMEGMKTISSFTADPIEIDF